MTLPLIITDLDFTPDCNLYEHIVSQHLKNHYTLNGHNFKIEETKNRDLDRLYQAALDKARTIFTSLELLSNNSRSCWAYVSNKDFNRNYIHHHIKTSVINMVYYLYSPKTENYRDGAIAIYKKDEKESEIFSYKPRTGDLLIMPSWLLHSPLCTQSEEHRVAVNMEIMCSYNPYHLIFSLNLL